MPFLSWSLELENGRFKPEAQARLRHYINTAIESIHSHSVSVRRPAPNHCVALNIGASLLASITKALDLPHPTLRHAYC